MKILLLFIFSLTSLSTLAFTPVNNLYIGADEKSSSLIDEQVFNGLMDRLEQLYAENEVEFIRDWEDGTVNAYAQIYDGKRYIFAFGGFARFPNMTEDTFAMVLCHEYGHHLGGTPRMRKANRWASAEGQADYYAANTCMKRYYSDWSVSELDDGPTPLPEVIDRCVAAYQNERDIAVCARTTMVGENLAYIFEQFDMYSMYIPSVLTPSKTVANKTYYDKYPSNQCRLDTYFAGASNANRPKCWYALPSAK